MLYLLFLLFVTVPLVEVYLLVEVIGPALGGAGTIGLILATGFAGAALVRAGGVKAMADIRRALEEGRLPGDELLAGLCTLVGAAFMITPGLLTDLVGFGLLLPPTQALAVLAIKQYLKHQVTMTMHVGGSGPVDMAGGQLFGDPPPGQPFPGQTSGPPPGPQAGPFPGPIPGPIPGPYAGGGQIKDVEIRDVDRESE